MVTTTAPVSADQRVVLSDISWQTYERLVAETGEHNRSRLVYDRGTLEIVSPGANHERDNRALSLIVWTVATELGLNFDDVGSVTYKHYRLKRGFEADSTFYLLAPDAVEVPDQIDGDTYRPPDLVIEIDYSRSSLGKLGLYAALGVPEVWRWNGEQTTFSALAADRYGDIEQSRMISVLTPAVVTRFVISNWSTPKPQWLRSIRDWVASVDNA